MFNVFKFLRTDPGAGALEQKLDSEKTLKKTIHVDTRKGEERVEYTPRQGHDLEVIQLRDSLTDMDTRLQSAIAERDQLKAEFSSYRQAANADQRDLEAENQRIRLELRTTGMMLSQQIAATGQPGPIPGLFHADESPKERTEQHFLKVARQMKGTSTASNPRPERISL
jgi:hypothetical protein